jgi:LPXTG-motif cell wall-anchored protein
MGIRFILVLVVGLLLVPAAAIAQENEDDICYVDPTSPECVGDEVIDRVEERPTEESSVLGVTLERGLPVTGAQLSAIVVLGAVLLALGGALVVSARRRGRAARV